MGLIPVLIALPVVVAAVIPFLKSSRIRSIFVYAGAGGIMALAATLLIVWLCQGSPIIT